MQGEFYAPSPAYVLCECMNESTSTGKIECFFGAQNAPYDLQLCSFFGAQNAPYDLQLCSVKIGTNVEF